MSARLTPLLLLSACHLFPVAWGDGEATTEAREVDAFSALTVDGPIDVAVTQGDAASVEVVCDGNLLDLIRTDVDEGVLAVRVENELGGPVRIHPEAACLVRVVATTLSSVDVQGSADVTLDGAAWDGLSGAFLTGSGDLTIHGPITAPALDVIVDGSGDLTLDGATTDTLTLTLSGSGDATTDGVTTGAFAAALSGSGRLEGSGAADTADVTSDGSGRVSLRELVAARVDARLTGSGSAQVTATDAITAVLSGTGSLAVWGGPDRRAINTFGTGDVLFRD